MAGELIHPDDLVDDTELDPAQLHEDSAASRFMTGLYNNTVGGLKSLVTTNPIDTLHQMFDAQVGEGSKAVDNFKQGRYSEALGHGAASLLPVFGPAAAHSGEEIGKGNIAGGLGEAAGLLASETGLKNSGAILKHVPEGVRGAGRVTSAVGRGLETVGNATKRPLGYAAAAEMIGSHPVGAAATMAAPYVAEYAGKGAQRLGKVMESFGDEGPRTRAKGFHPQVSREKSYRMAGEPVAAEAAAQGNPLASEMAPAEPAGRLAGKGPGLNNVLDDVLNSLREDTTLATRQSGKLPDTPSVRHLDAPPEPVSNRVPINRAAELDNITSNAPFGEGHVLPGQLPTELQSLVSEGADTGKIYNSDLGTVHDRIPKDFSFEAGNADVPGITGNEMPQPSTLPEFTYEAGQADVPGLTAGDPSAMGRLDNATQGLSPAESPTTLPHPLSEIPDAAPYWASKDGLINYARQHPELAGTEAGRALDTRIRVLHQLDLTAGEREMRTGSRSWAPQ